MSFQTATANMERKVYFFPAGAFILTHTVYFNSLYFNCCYVSMAGYFNVHIFQLQFFYCEGEAPFVILL
jgi:hypothetical protein